MCTSLWIQMGSQLKHLYSRGLCPTLAHVGTQFFQIISLNSLYFRLSQKMSQKNRSTHQIKCPVNCHVEPATTVRRGCLPLVTCHHPPHSLGSAVAGTALSCTVICRAVRRHHFSHFCGVLCFCWYGPYHPSLTQCLPGLLIHCPASSPLTG